MEITQILWMIAIGWTLLAVGKSVLRHLLLLCLAIPFKIHVSKAITMALLQLLKLTIAFYIGSWILC